MKAEIKIFAGTMAIVAVAAVAMAMVGISILRPSSYLSNATTYFSGWVLLACVHIAAELVKNKPDDPWGHIRAIFDDSYMRAV